MDDFLAAAYAEDEERKKAIVRECPELANDVDFWDAHCCASFDDGTGYCDICGAVIPHTSAYYDVYGCDPPEHEDDE